MHVVILGCGRVGATLALMLEANDHSVAIVDRDREAFRRLGRDFKGETVFRPRPYYYIFEAISRREMIRHLIIFLFECLDDELPIDQVLQSRFPRLLQFGCQLVSGVLSAQHFLPWDDQLTHLRIGDDLAFCRVLIVAKRYNRGDTIDNLRLGRIRGATHRWDVQGHNGQNRDRKQTHH